MPRVSDRHKERRRAEILRAALLVFNRKGYERATVDDIAAASGLSVGAIYRYFPSKAEIMLALIERRLGHAPEVFDRVTAGLEDPWERLLTCVDTFAAALRFRHPENGNLLLVAWAEAVHDEAVRQGLHSRFSGLVEYLGNIIRDGIARGRFRSEVDAHALATYLLCSADGVTFNWVVESPGMDLLSLRDTVAPVLRHYLLVTPAAT